MGKRHVLTAAHCVCYPSERLCIFLKNCTEQTECVLWKNLGVALGDHDTITDDGEKVFRIKNTIVNEKYGDQVSLNEEIQLIQLPSEDITCTLGTQFIASGWGKDRYQNK